MQSVITEQITAMHRRVETWTPDTTDAWDPLERWPTSETPPSGTPAVVPARGGDGSVADRLVQLDELRRRGIVNDAEFAAKKAELLARL